MKILLIEPFFAGSHKSWALGLQKYSRHSIEILKMNGSYWKWRMHGGAVTLARKFMRTTTDYDLILCSDMLDLTTFQSLTRSRTSQTPFAIYFHENQLMYPWSPDDRDIQFKRDHHYAFINYSSALSADQCFFNSEFHLNGFNRELINFLKGFPDHNELNSLELIKSKSSLLYLGLDLKRFDPYYEKNPSDLPIVLWNHRWEHDKNPDDFFELLLRLKRNKIPFQLVVLGEKYHKTPEIFEKAEEQLGDHLLHWGFADSFEDYANWLWRSDLLLVTSNQDFFGGSIIEAIYCNTYPLLPDRLAYPEHIPEEHKEACLYNDQEELYQKAKDYLENKPKSALNSLKGFVSRYDWTHIIAKYDLAFEQLKKAT